MAERAAQAVRASDFEVVGEASDGLEGVKLVEQVEADVVLLDVDMPSMNGREALEQIRETHPDLSRPGRSHADGE